MSAETLPQLHTFEEFCEVVEDGQKADLIDGIIYMAPPDSLRNNQLATFLIVLLEGYARKHSLGQVYASRVAFKLDRSNGPEPDVALVRPENADRLRDGHVAGGPDLAIEIVSPDSIERDYVRKRVLYEQAGVPEYWIVDPLRRSTLFLRLLDGKYHEVSFGGSVARSEVLPGFWLDTNWLFEDVLPDPFECLQQILAGEPVEVREGDNA